MLIDALNAIEDRFCTLIGIDNANTDKRERLISSEVAANKAETKALSSLWLEEIKAGMEKCKNMFGITLDCELSEVGRGVQNGIGIGNVQRKPESV